MEKKVESAVLEVCLYARTVLVQRPIHARNAPFAYSTLCYVTDSSLEVRKTQSQHCCTAARIDRFSTPELRQCLLYFQCTSGCTTQRTYLRKRCLSSANYVRRLNTYVRTSFTTIHVHIPIRTYVYMYILIVYIRTCKYTVHVLYVYVHVLQVQVCLRVYSIRHSCCLPVIMITKLRSELSLRMYVRICVLWWTPLHFVMSHGLTIVRVLRRFGNTHTVGMPAMTE